MRGKLDEKQLTEIYLGKQKDERISVIIKAIHKYQPNIESIKGLGFCVSRDHAKYMAECFNRQGLPSIALTSETNKDERVSAQSKLGNGELKFIFTVDLYNEGVDIPEINTELMLRPSDSLTIFIQQLGRGLRRSAEKSELVVLDFVGQFEKEYHMYEEKLGYMASCSAYTVTDKINGGFMNLPAGCSINLEKVAKERILESISRIQSHNSKKKFLELIKKYRLEYGENPNLRQFMEFSGLGIDHVYSLNHTLTSYIYETLGKTIESSKDDVFGKFMSRLATIDSATWIMAIKDMLFGEYPRNEQNKVYATMLYYTFNPNSTGAKPEEYPTVWHFIDYLKSESLYLKEIGELLNYKFDSIDFLGPHADLGFVNGLDIHCSYSKEQILVALGRSTFEKRYPLREGVCHINNRKLDFFLINLNKSEKDFSPTTMYKDYPLNETLFHWQSQSGTTPESKTGQRYIHHVERGNKILLFTREKNMVNNRALPYIFLGEAEYVSHEGSKPISIVWRMKENIPLKVLKWSPAARL